MKPNERFTVDERAERFQRRQTGPWRTVNHELGPVMFTHRYRRRRHIDFVRMDVALHDLWVHVIGRQLVLPLLDRFARWLE